MEQNKKNANTVDMMSLIADRTMALAKENSVLGEAIEKDGLTIIPVSKLSVSFAGGGADMLDGQHNKRNLPAGGGAKVSFQPMSFLVIKEGRVQVVNVQAPENTTGTQIAELVINEIKNLFAKKEIEIAEEI